MMRRLIAIVSGICAIGFAVALANTSDNTDTSQSQTTTTTTSSAKTCTDDNGVTYYRGHSGFDTCMSQMKKSNQNQMSGTVDQGDANTNSNANDSNSGTSTTTDTNSNSSSTSSNGNAVNR